MNNSGKVLHDNDTHLFNERLKKFIKKAEI